MQAVVAWYPASHRLDGEGFKGREQLVSEQKAERTELQRDALECVCSHRKEWAAQQNFERQSLDFPETAVKCDVCMQELVAEAVRLRFMGECDERRR